MSKTNQEIVHDFFYSDLNSSYCNSRATVSYARNKLYSYSTVIALVVKDKNGDFVALMSSNSMTPTTRKHIILARRASPFRVYNVPFYMRHDCETLEKIPQLFLDTLENLAEAKMTLKANSEAFYSVYVDAVRFSNNVKTIRGLAKFKRVAESLESREGINLLEAQKEAKRERERKVRIRKLALENQEFERNIKRLENAESLAEKIRIVFLEKSTKRYELKNALESEFDYHPSFIWRDEEGDFKTSQGILVSKAEGEKALSAYKLGILKHGDKINRYSVINMSGKCIKVGCHNVPIENVKALLAGDL